MLFQAIRRGHAGPDKAPPFIPFDLISAAEKRLTTEEDIPIPDMNTLYRVSNMSRMCEREEVLRHLLKVKATKKVDSKLQKTFDFGHGFHYIVQNKWFGAWGWLEGDWRCQSCGAKHVKQLRPSKCQNCNSSETFEYIELELENIEHYLTGHPDGILVLANYRYLLELKTSNTKYFQWIRDVRRMPLDAHLDQVNLYLFLLGIQRAIVVYFDKDTSDWMQFHVMYDKARVERLLEKIRTVKNGIQLGEVPPRKMCDKPGCARAMGCSVRNQCFSRQ